ncbi:hypothetical protein LTR28_007015 [Elasticomyces elasticus]|nr:hypothetical protein LTR28_007015 [Elasticomyces elasticus]
MLAKQHQLAESINHHMTNHSKRYSRSSRRPSHTSPIDDGAMIETLKLLFNITYYHPGLASSFTSSIPHILKILCRIQLPSPPLEQPIKYLINALMNLDLGNKSAEVLESNPLFPRFNEEQHVERLVYILDQAIQTYPERELDQAAAPTLTLIRRTFELAPVKVRNYMKWLMLPTEDSRTKPLGQDDTLASRLLRCSTSPMLPTLRESISALMFELSDKDATKLVHNIGYGYASGFLMSHNIAVPHNTAKVNSASSGSKSANSVPEGINPVTGQRLDAEPRDAGPEMTEDEKEREAERLFVLFESPSPPLMLDLTQVLYRLKATGVVDVKNPVQQARDEGRFEELD